MVEEYLVAAVVEVVAEVVLGLELEAPFSAAVLVEDILRLQRMHVCLNSELILVYPLKYPL